MRQDMRKVICERPRRGHAERSQKTGLKLNPHLDWDSGDHDWGPTRASSSRLQQESKGYTHKRLNDYLSPLERFLHSAVGRPWDDVFSEIVTHADSRSLTGHHLLTHVKQYVDTNLLVGEADIVCRVRYGFYRYVGFYVNPESGLLCYQERLAYANFVRPVESLHWHDNFWFKLEHIRRAADGCSILSNAPACQHHLPPEAHPSIWYVIEYGYHDPDKLISVIRYETASDWERVRYSLAAPGDSHSIRYKDRPERLKEPFVVAKRQANRKEMKVIRALLGGCE